MRDTVTIYVPHGYKNAKEFLQDCEFEEVKPVPIPWDAYHNRSYGPVEERAAQIYDKFEAPSYIKKPAWMPGGNSTKQDEARQLARKELVAAGHSPAASNGERQ
jgi:hypothetical protein